MATKMKNINVYLPDDLRKKVEAEAERHMRSVSNMIVIVLYKHFNEKQNGDGHAR